MDVEFKDLCYTVSPRRWSRNGLHKRVLKSVSGVFKSGELSAIMGPSGAGKSSLLNAVSGYRTLGVTGTLCTNGKPRDSRIFHKLSCYITQEDLIQPLLTVQEIMMVAAQLKLPSQTSENRRLSTVEEVLKNLGLFECKNTRTEMLSGGQKKRLSIALELINNPPIFFLDEPTSGLDNVTAKQVLQPCELWRDKPALLSARFTSPARHCSRCLITRILCHRVCVCIRAEHTNSSRSCRLQDSAVQHITIRLTS